MDSLLNFKHLADTASVIALPDLRKSVIQIYTEWCNVNPKLK